MGDVITYTYTVTNNGSSDSPALENVVLTDDHGTPAFAGGDGDGDGKLDKGETWTYTLSRAVQAGDPDPLINNAEVNANVTDVSEEGFDGRNPVRNVASATVNLYQPSFKVAKSGDTLGKVTDPADYRVVGTNTSSDDTPDLTSPVVIDSLLGDLLDPANPFLVDSDADGAMSPGEVWTLDFRRVVQVGDADPLPNTVSAQFSVTNGFGDTHLLAPSSASVLSHSVNLIQPNFGIVKTALDGDGVVTVGDTVTYEIVIGDDSSADSTGLARSVSSTPRSAPWTRTPSTRAWTTTTSCSRARPGPASSTTWSRTATSPTWSTPSRPRSRSSRT